MAFELKRVRAIRDAEIAKCDDCNVWIGGSLYWDISRSIWLHKHGSGSDTCKIRLFKSWAEHAAD